MNHFLQPQPLSDLRRHAPLSLFTLPYYSYYYLLLLILLLLLLLLLLPVHSFIPTFALLFSILLAALCFSPTLNCAMASIQ